MRTNTTCWIPSSFGSHGLLLTCLCFNEKRIYFCRFGYLGRYVRPAGSRVGHLSPPLDLILRTPFYDESYGLRMLSGERVAFVKVAR